MTDKLFIIGNGFDIHHGLKTSYADFRDNYAKKSLPLWNSLFDLYGDSIYKDMWWSDFEGMLSNVDYAHLVNSKNGNALGFMKTRNFMKGILPPLFGSWIKNIRYNIDPDSSLSIDSDSLYFSFNYTLVLEKVYNVNDEHVWHIHNSIKNPDEIIVGHDSDRRDLSMKWTQYKKDNPEAEIGNMTADLINQEIVNGAKKVKERIALDGDRFYEQYSSIRHYEVMGFSFNDIDMPYIEEIVKVNSQIDGADWTLYYHFDGEDKQIIQKLAKLGIKEGNMNEPIRW